MLNKTLFFLVLCTLSSSLFAKQILVLKATESYPKTGEWVNSQVYVADQYIRIDGNNTSSIFRATEGRLEVYDHASKTRQSITRENLSRLKSSIADGLEKGTSPLNSKLYTLEQSDETTLIDGFATTLGRLRYDGQLVADFYMVSFTKIGHPEGNPPSVRAWHQFFAGYLHDFPSRDLALHSHSTAGLLESAGIDMNDYGFLRVIFYDAQGRIEKLVESRPQPDHNLSMELFKGFDYPLNNPE